ncbi:hypothetical protein PPMP20_35230 [Paraburkholderia phymatum]|uniref:hypothetical protein n=1 Tax=Paraburkholderia phymatum TaxID=148447 RepID=UPI0012FD9FC9|nr:hypothetical protein [Paraburkholderia phymatum]
MVVITICGPIFTKNGPTCPFSACADTKTVPQFTKTIPECKLGIDFKAFIFSCLLVGRFYVYENETDEALQDSWRPKIQLHKLLKIKTILTNSGVSQKPPPGRFLCG